MNENIENLSRGSKDPIKFSSIVVLTLFSLWTLDIFWGSQQCSTSNKSDACTVLVSNYYSLPFIFLSWVNIGNLSRSSKDPVKFPMPIQKICYMHNACRQLSFTTTPHPLVMGGIGNLSCQRIQLGGIQFSWRHNIAQTRYSWGMLLNQGIIMSFTFQSQFV